MVQESSGYYLFSPFKPSGASANHFVYSRTRRRAFYSVQPIKPAFPPPHPPLQAPHKPHERRLEKHEISLLMNCREKVSTRLVSTVQISNLLLFISRIIGD